ncbi:MAG: replicative DNA helicase [Actinobacteria bacterium]|nr:replicative DNA helicase [Actinomycetota bacterium]
MSAPAPAGYDRVPPHNLDAEVSVLGSMLLSKNAIAEVVEFVGPEDFYRGAHRTMFEAIRELYDRGEPVDSVTLADELQRRGTLDSVGGLVAITDLISQVPTAANAGFYARIVAEHALRRRLIDAGTDITKVGYDPAVEADDAIDHAEATIFQVAQRSYGRELLPMKDLLSQSFELIEKRYENKQAITGLPTGFVDFDRLTSGLQPGQLVIVAARPGLGKSTLCTNIATHVAVDLRRPVVMFSLEMSQMELVERVLSAQARIDNDRLRNGHLRDDDWPKLSQAMGRLGEANFYIDDTAGINLMEIRSKCRRLKQRHGLDLIIIDYLQLMQSHRRVDNRVQEVSELSRGLKVLAKELDTPVIALSQLSRKPEDRSGEDKKPRLSDLRESGSIEQDADIVAFIYREDAYVRDSARQGEAELRVAKHRGGPLKDIQLSFIGHQSRFASMARGATAAL